MNSGSPETGKRPHPDGRPRPRVPAWTARCRPRPPSLGPRKAGGATRSGRSFSAVAAAAGLLGSVLLLNGVHLSGCEFPWGFWDSRTRASSGPLCSVRLFLLPVVGAMRRKGVLWLRDGGCSTVGGTLWHAREFSRLTYASVRWRLEPHATRTMRMPYVIGASSVSCSRSPVRAR